MIVLSAELNLIATDFQARHEIGKRQLHEVGDFLAALARLAASMERELEVHRLAEAGQLGRAAVEQLATDQFIGLVVDPDAKVVRPDFGKGARS